MDAVNKDYTLRRFCTSHDMASCNPPPVLATVSNTLICRPVIVAKPSA